MSVKRINLALQGGGAHGAFTWGVLDRLLEEDDLEIAAISGCSAGALNTVALKAGMVTGGREAARENLDWLWQQLGAVKDGRMAEWLGQSAPDVGLMSKALEMSPAYAFADVAGRMVSPYSQGAFYRNPLERIVNAFHYEYCADQAGPRIFIGATNVRNGKVRLFTGAEIGPKAVLASACLPTLFQAVAVKDPATGAVDHFWDGGYSGNPALFPLFEPELPNDIVVVHINPLVREDLPRTPQDIQNRINEISFNSSLLRELRAISFVRKLIANGKVEKGAMKDVLVHMIADDALMNKLSVATKLIPNPVVIGHLKEAGRRAAGEFLHHHKDSIGVEATVDLHAMFD